MSEHEIVWSFHSSGTYLSQEARCNASSDAACRNMPTCNCEEWEGEQRDDQGWFHLAYGPVALVPDDIHRHTEPSDCNICTWLNESDILECTSGSFTLELAVTPIRPSWQGPGYDWEPA